jgi:hypothetical protein
MTTPNKDSAATAAAPEGIPERPNDLKLDGQGDERLWVKPAIPAANVARAMEQQHVVFGDVGFNPMARDPHTGELLHPWPPKD